MDLSPRMSASKFFPVAELPLPQALLLLMLLVGCHSEPAPQATAVTHTAPGSGAHIGDVDWFVDRAESSGLPFSYFNGMSGDFYFPEMLPAGVALFDYDNDGDLDVFFVQGQMLGDTKTVSQATIQPASLPLKGRLFRNDLQINPDGTRAPHFTDVTEKKGIDPHGFGVVAAAA